MKPFNNMTILRDGSGQITGELAEIKFSKILIVNGISFKWVGKEKGHHDFAISMGNEIVKVDVKCKKRNVKVLPEFDAHVNLYQKGYDCRIYVFSSLTGKNLEFMGWCGKNEFWESCRMVKKGDIDSVGFVEKLDSGKLAYNKLRSMESLFLFK